MRAMVGIKIEELLLQHCTAEQKAIWERSRESRRRHQSAAGASSDSALVALGLTAAAAAKAGSSSSSSSGGGGGKALSSGVVGISALSSSSSGSGSGKAAPDLHAIIKEFAVDFYDRHPHLFDSTKFVF